MKAYCPICSTFRKVDENERCKVCGNENTRPVCRKCEKRGANYGSSTCEHCDSIAMDAEMERRC